MRLELAKVALKDPAKAYVQWRRAKRRELGRYLSTDRLNAMQLALRICRNRRDHWRSPIERLHVLTVAAQDFESQMNKISWEYFNEALVLFELNHYGTYSNETESLTEHQMRSNGISYMARRLVRFLEQRHNETDDKYLRRVCRRKLAKIAIFLTAAYDMNPKIRPKHDLLDSRILDIRAHNKVNHLKMTRSMWTKLEIVSWRMERQHQKNLDNPAPKHMRITFERDCGEAQSRLSYMFTEIALLTKENSSSIQHTAEVCPKCKKEKLDPLKVREFEGHTLYVWGQLASDIVLQTSFRWSTSEDLYDWVTLYDELYRMKYNPVEKNWFKLELYK